MKYAWFLLAVVLASMTSSSPLKPPDPRASVDEYMQAVATSIQDLVSGQRARDPRMSGASTGRLLLEGVVENLRIYRLYRQETGREGKKKEKHGDGDPLRGQSRRERSRDRGHHHRSRRQRRAGDGEAYREGQSRHRHSSPHEGGEHLRRRRHHHRSGERHGERGFDGQQHQGRDQNEQGPAANGNETAASDSRHLMSGALQAADALFGPGGTPFGYLPTRDKGMGFIAHARNVYQHVKAEQNAGHRSKGFAEKRVDAALRKSKGTKEDQRSDDAKPLLEPDTRGRGETDGGDQSRRRRRNRSRCGEHERRLNRSDYPIYVPVNEVSQGSRGAGRVPTVRVESPTPPQHTEPTKSSILSVSGATSRPHTEIDPGRPQPATGCSNSPNPSFSPPASIPLPAGRAREAATPSVTDAQVSVVPNAPPLPPTPPAFVSQSSNATTPSTNSARDALFASIQAGVTLKTVREEDKKDGSAARKDETRIEDVHEGTPTYEETPYSHEVEALERAQAVEEKEWEQEEEGTTSTKTPLITPQPRMRIPTNFQDELANKLSSVNLNGQGDGAAEAGSSGARVLRTCASNETWRTIFTEKEEENRMPNRQFRQDLGSKLSTGDSLRPLAAAAAAAAAVAQTVTDLATPAPVVFVNLSANIARPGWQPGSQWDFGNVPVDGKDGPSGDRT